MNDVNMAMVGIVAMFICNERAIDLNTARQQRHCYRASHTVRGIIHQGRTPSHTQRTRSHNFRPSPR